MSRRVVLGRIHVVGHGQVEGDLADALRIGSNHRPRSAVARQRPKLREDLGSEEHRGALDSAIDRGHDGRVRRDGKPARRAGTTPSGSRGWSPSAIRTASVVCRQRADADRNGAPLARPPGGGCGRSARASPASAAWTSVRLVASHHQDLIRRGEESPRRSSARRASRGGRSSSFWRPMRRARPAARTTAAIKSGRAGARGRPRLRGRRACSPVDYPLARLTAASIARRAKTRQRCDLYSTEPCRSACTSTPSAAFWAAASMTAASRTLPVRPGLHALGPHGLGAGAGHPHPCLRARALGVEGHGGGRPDHREARGGMRELHVGGAAPGRPGWARESGRGSRPRGRRWTSNPGTSHRP